MEVLCFCIIWVEPRYKMEKSRLTQIEPKCRMEKSRLITKRLFYIKGGRRDSNPRLPAPQTSALTN